VAGKVLLVLLTLYGMFGIQYVRILLEPLQLYKKF